MINSVLRLVLSLLALSAIAAAARPPVGDFVKRPAINSVEISEGGRYVAFLTPNDMQYFDLNLYDLQTKESKRFDLGGGDVTRFEWIDANRMIVSDLNIGNSLYRERVVDVKDGKVVANIGSRHEFFQILSSLRRDEKLFVARFYDDGRGSQGLAIINSRLQPRSIAGLNNSRYNVQEWIDLPKGEYHGAMTDLDGEVRLVAIYSGKQLRHYYRKSAKDAWLELPFDYETTDVIGFTNDSDLIYVSRYSPDAASSRLHRYRVSQSDFGPPLFEDPRYSLSEASLLEVRTANGQARSLALQYQRDLPTQLALDPEFAAVQKAVNARIPGRLNLITSCDNELKQFVVSSSNGREPSRYTIYNHATGNFLPLPDPTPWFKASEMSVMRPVKFTARDGLELEGYLSLPSSSADGHKPPLVVYPHGGPWARDTWGFNSDTQFLTSRGYAVFQPNYRGSTGFSRAVSKDDDFAFRKMHDDVTDGVRHLVAQGIVDEKRLAIYGGSFGGYLAVAGVAFEPQLYRCAITFAGVFDWKRLIKQSWSQSDDDEFNYDRLLQKLGNPATQEERFLAFSPIAHIAAVRAPVLVVHGQMDTVVDYRQSTKLLAELNSHKVPHEKLFFATEFHGFSEPANYQKFLEALERFLAKHL